jgi:hypothetical protein
MSSIRRKEIIKIKEACNSMQENQCEVMMFWGFLWRIF